MSGGPPPSAFHYLLDLNLRPAASLGDKIVPITKTLPQWLRPFESPVQSGPAFRHCETFDLL